MTFTLDFQGQILKKSYLRSGMADWHGIKGMWVNRECWTHSVTFNVHLTGQNLKKSYLRNGMADWHGRKGMWVDRMLHPLCDFQCPPHPWPWLWIFKVKFWKCCISGMGGQIDMERKGFESTECWTHVVTFNVYLFRDLDLGFSRSNFEKVVSQEWDGWLTWNKRDVSR